MNKMKRIANQKCENSTEKFWQFSHNVVSTISNFIGKVQIEDWRLKRNYVDPNLLLIGTTVTICIIPLRIL